MCRLCTRKLTRSPWSNRVLIISMISAASLPATSNLHDINILIRYRTPTKRLLLKVHAILSILVPEEVDFGDGIFWKWTVASESDQPWARGRVWLHHFDGGMWSASWPYVGHGDIFALSSTYVRRDDILALSDFR